MLQISARDRFGSPSKIQLDDLYKLHGIPEPVDGQAN